MANVCMIVIYNHNYEANIEKIEQLYRGKFNDIFHLVPFYTGNKENVIKVYGSAYQFNEYFMQGASKFVNEKYSHYVFVADDMILNPEFNQDNILQYLNLDENSGFFNEYSSIDYDAIFNWDWSFQSLRAIIFNKNGCEYQKFIPSLEEAQKSFEKHGLYGKNITKKNFEQVQKLFVNDPQNYYKYKYSFWVKNIFNLLGMKFVSFILGKFQKGYYTYPLAFGYSDFFVIPNKKIKEFLHISSIFASIRIFVEVAIPTAMVLSLDKIVNKSDIDYIPGVISDDFAKENDYSIKNLTENWTKNVLFCHPVKLSKWKE